MIGDNLYQLTSREESDPTASEFFQVISGNAIANPTILTIEIPENKLLLIDFVHFYTITAVDLLAQLTVGVARGNDITRFFGTYTPPVAGSYAFTLTLNKMPMAWPRIIRAEFLFSGIIGPPFNYLAVGGTLLPIGTYLRR